MIAANRRCVCAHNFQDVSFSLHNAQVALVSSIKALATHCFGTGLLFCASTHTPNERVCVQNE